jgi:uncharacterized protein (DUF2147 family)
MRYLMTAAALLWAGAALADPIEGLWKTLPDDNGNYGYVEVKPCADKLCGALVKAFDPAGKDRPSENIGKNIVWDMVAAGAGSYTDGKVWAPDRDRTYASTMQKTGDTLAVSGCVLGGLICRAQDWTRVR